jgi:hypothetical protein
MWVLSFDIGVKNLAYCYACDAMITKWGTLDISADNIYLISKKCIIRKPARSKKSQDEIDSNDYIWIFCLSTTYFKKKY